MSQQAEVKVRIRQEGAEATKQALMETRAALLGVSKEQLSNAHTTRELARDANVLNNMERFKTRIFLAQHPVINNLSRAMSTFGSISRGVLSITTAFSTAILAFNSTNNGLAQLQSELDQARREQALSLEKYGYDSQEYADATEKVNELQGKIGDLNNQLQQEKLINILNFAGAIGIIGSSAVSAAKDIHPHLAKGGALARLFSWAGGMATLGPALGFAAGALAGIALFEATKGDDFKPAIMDLSTWDKFNEAMVATSMFFSNMFLVSIPAALASASLAFQGFWRGVVAFANSAVNAIIASVEFMINAAIAAINRMIRGANTIAGAIGLPKIGLIDNVSLGRVGQSAVSTAPAARGPGGFTGQPTVNNYITVQGSVLSDMELAKTIDRHTKDGLKRSGWT